MAAARAAPTAAFSKKTTTSKLGGEPLPQGPAVDAVPAPPVAAFSDFERLTRVTPCTLRRRDISVATAGWLRVHPASSMAGAPIAPRMPEPLAAPSPPPTVPVSELRVTLSGTARERSRSDCSQSKRALASACTVAARSWASVWKSA